jgi:hypothetical protein
MASGAWTGEAIQFIADRKQTKSIQEGPGCDIVPKTYPSDLQLAFTSYFSPPPNKAIIL